MTEKKKQHTIPQVHLRQFATTERPGSADSLTEPFVWLVPADLRGPSKARAPRNAFASTRAYNVSADDPESPWLENAFGRLEGNYGVAIRRLVSSRRPSKDDWLDIVMFVAGLRVRTDTDMGHWQEMVEKLEHLYRQVEKGHTGSERHADVLFRGSMDFSKKQVPDRVAAYARVVGPSAWLLVNRSPLDFVSADIPVAHQFIHPDQLVALGIPIGWVEPSVTRATQTFVSVCPLTPRLAIMSSPFLIVPDGLFREAALPRTALAINELMRVSARSTLISRAEKPYRNVQPILSRDDQELSSATSDPDSHVVTLYTRDNRFTLRATTFIHEHGPHPLRSTMRFRTSDMPTLRALAKYTDITEIRASKGKQEVGGMRDAILLAVACDAEGESIIEQDPTRR